VPNQPVLDVLRPSGQAWQEGRNVQVVDGGAIAFGRHLDEPAIDCGAFLFPPQVFGCQLQAAADGDHTLAGLGLRGAFLRRPPAA